MTETKNVNDSYIFYLRSQAIVAKKLQVDGKITACVKEICLLDVACKVRKKYIV